MPLFFVLLQVYLLGCSVRSSYTRCIAISILCFDRHGVLPKEFSLSHRNYQILFLLTEMTRGGWSSRKEGPLPQAISLAPSWHFIPSQSSGLDRPISVYSGGHKKIPQTAWLTQHLFFTAWRPNIQDLGAGPCQLADGHILAVPSCSRGRAWALWYLLRTPILSNQSPILMTSFNCNYFFRPNTATLGGRASTSEFWGIHFSPQQAPTPNTLFSVIRWGLLGAPAVWCSNSIVYTGSRTSTWNKNPLL